MTQDEKVGMVHGDGEGSYAGHVSAIPRLGIPDLKLQDGSEGVGDQRTQVTFFPAPITLAATWDATSLSRSGRPWGPSKPPRGRSFCLSR